MPRIERTAQIVWEGNAARGAGAITGGSGAFAGLDFTQATRIGDPAGKTSPEELLAAAHGACLSMSLASELTRRDTPPQRLDVACRIVMDEVEGQGHQIVASHVDLTAAAAGADEQGLDAAVEAADQGCPFSALLKRAGVDVSISARLV